MTKRDIAQVRWIARELGIEGVDERDGLRRFIERHKREQGFRGDPSYAQLRWLGREFLAERDKEIPE